MTQTTTEVQRYRPAEPVRTVATLKTLVAAMADSLRQVLPKHVTPERVQKLMLVAVNRNPKILECSGTSIMETISRAAELGLDLSGTLGEAYPVPYWTKGGSQCQLIIGYRGLAKLARQSGEIARLEAEVVYSNDKFTYRKGAKFVLDFEPCLKADRGNVIGAYALAEFKDGSIQAEFMPTSEIEKIQTRSKSKDHGPWTTDWNEMARKTVFRRLAKWLPLSAEKFQQAVEADNDDYEGPEVVEAATAAGDATAGNRRLLGKLTETVDTTTGEVTGAPPTPADEPGANEIDDAAAEAATTI